RQTHPEDNNERQGIHEHVSVPLRTSASGGASSKKAAGVAAKATPRPAASGSNEAVGSGGLH
ncbi:MAG TPA: hypothetical protein VE545_08645, partial [Candidatus Dormibacteraeota bacterium]|nr:hypothetical protein [Candidatus Dormibacteraeota bacterium]